jgi:DNA/RNA-binding domain of Phe-tRNA-synthetase-like protein
VSFAVEHRLPGWALAWAQLEVLDGAREAAAAARESCAAAARRGGLRPDEPVVAAIRSLFRAAGTDPTRYRPSSEALLRRLLKGEALPAIHPLVDLNNCLSVSLRVPSCVMAEGSFEAPVTLRRGEPGERMDSLRGDFDLAGKPLLADRAGPFGTPITDSSRVAVAESTRRGWLVAYLPAGVVDGSEVEAALCGPLGGIARVAGVFRTADGTIAGGAG